MISSGGQGAQGLIRISTPNGMVLSSRPCRSPSPRNGRVYYGYYTYVCIYNYSTSFCCKLRVRVAHRPRCTAPDSANLRRPPVDVDWGAQAAGVVLQSHTCIELGASSSGTLFCNHSCVVYQSWPQQSTESQPHAKATMMAHPPWCASVELLATARCRSSCPSIAGRSERSSE